MYPSTPMRKKTPYYKYKEKEKNKQKREDDESAKLYQHFVESFEAGQEPSTPEFVRGETIHPDNKPTESNPQVSSPEARTTSRDSTRREFTPSQEVVASRIMETARAFERSSVESNSSLRKTSRSKPKHIDLMLENIKREQEERASRSRLRRTGFDQMTEKRLDLPSSAVSDIKTTTTNLYVGNLAPDLTEDILKREFGKFGAIASVKIMWPRDEDQVKRGSNVGFVAFMERECAAKCIEKLNGEKLHGLELRIGWGKSVPLPSVPLFSSSSSGQMEISPTKMPDRIMKQQSMPTDEESSKNDVQVVIPEDIHVRYVIDTLAAFVLRDGVKFEQMVKRKEVSNPAFAFLYKDGLPDNVYYRWKLFSLAQGDSMKCWRLEPFYMTCDGPKWIPPTMCIGDGSQLTAAQKGGEAAGKKKLLSEMERDKLKDLLSSLTANRSKICEIMVFALNNAEAADEIVEILVESLCQFGTAITLKIAQLFLVSDILHNSSASVRNASQYRSRLEEKLPDVFENLQEVYSSLHTKKDMQETVKKYVLRVLRVWRNWFIFSNDYLNGLQSTFLASLDSIKEDSEHLRKLHGLQGDEIERKCRQNGLSLTGGVVRQKLRLARLEIYLHGTTSSKMETKPVKEKSQMKRQMSTGSAKRYSGEKKSAEKRTTSSWTQVRLEQKPKVPISQWLQTQKIENSPTKEIPKPLPVKRKDLAETKPVKLPRPNQDFDMFAEDAEVVEPQPEVADTIPDLKRQRR